MAKFFDILLVLLGSSLLSARTADAFCTCSPTIIINDRNARTLRPHRPSPSSRRTSNRQCTFSTSPTRLHGISPQEFLDYMSETASEALGRTVHLESTSGGGATGGGGASTSAVVDKHTGEKYFVKSAAGEYEMLQAEYLGVKAMAETNTIQVPTPICFGQFESGISRRAFVLFEYLEFTGGGDQYDLGVQLAKMHRHTSDNGLFGFDVDNTIGATPQPNLPWCDNWADFWDTHRLGHMLKLTDNEGYSDKDIQILCSKTREMLSQHNPEPSILHGDLWGGNKAFCKKDGKVSPVIFDPATYYGDREADVAMTELFGGFGNDFYDGYNEEWPLAEGYEERKEIYNLYHVLNHDVLFGGMYMNRARGMMDRIIGKYSNEPEIYY